MPDETKIAICSSILEKGGKFAALIHRDDDTPIYQTEFMFDTLDDARDAGTKLLDRCMELLKKDGLTVYRPGASHAQ